MTQPEHAPHYPPPQLVGVGHCPACCPVEAIRSSERRNTGSSWLLLIVLVGLVIWYEGRKETDDAKPARGRP